MLIGVNELGTQSRVSVYIIYGFSQTSQLSRFGRETHDFSIGLTTACSSHDFSRFYRNSINMC